jgi:beta-lactamase class A
MTTNTPPQSILPTQNSAQHDAFFMDDAALSRSDLGDAFKALILRHRIEQAIQQNDAEAVITGVTIVDLQSDRTLVDHNAVTEHFAASINKLPVMLLILEDLRSGRLTMDQIMTWQASDVRAGSGVFDQPGAPLQAPLQDVIYDLLHRSGNTAVRILVNQGLGGAAAVNARWAEKPQLSHTYLQPLDANRFFLGFTTPDDSLWTIKKLLRKPDIYTQFIKDAMATNIFTDVSVRSQLAGNEYIVLVNKVGLLDDVDGNNRHDVGIIYNTQSHKSYAYSLMTTSPFESPTATPRAENSLKEMGGSLLRFAGDRAQVETMAETFQAAGEPVEQGRILY